MRQKRFVRGIAPDIEITEYDLYIINQVYLHRFIRSFHLCALLRSKQYPLRRLGDLYRAGYLERPRLQVQYYKSGSDPMVYSMTTKGARLIGVTKRIEDVDKNPSHHLFQHTLLTTDFMVRMELSAVQHHLEFKRLPIGEWKTNLFYEGKRITRKIVPDAAFQLEDKTFFLETDTGTMPLARARNDHQTSILKKQTVYKEAWRNKAFAFDNLRVIFYTSDRQRRERMSALLPSPMFLYTDQAEIETCLNGDIIGKEWVNGQGEKSILI